MQWDVFICHASEDKATVARPLAEALQQNGLRVWLDEQELVLGDSIRRKVDEGLARSRWGVLVLSQPFLEKEWPQAELDALLARELGGERVILPVWHGVTGADVARRSPLLAARLAIDSEQGIESICTAILTAVGRESPAPRHAKPKRPALLALWQLLLTKPGFSLSEVYGRLEARESYAGQSIGGYTLRELVGIGGSGVVFKAVHGALGRQVAFKLFFPFGDDLRALTQATERAVRGLSSLRHPGIAALLDYGYLRIGHGAALYLAYEFVDGCSLDDWSRSLGSVGAPSSGVGPRAVLSRRLDVAIAIVEALHEAHGCRFIDTVGFSATGVMHGDLKPSNILVSRHGAQPVLLDFMMPDLQRLAAERLDRWLSWEKDTEGRYGYSKDFASSTMSFGTPGYMPPEQEVDGIVTPASDVYALGRTFEELFWPAGPGKRLMLRATVSRSVCAATGIEVDRLITWMTAAQPDERPASASEVLSHLRRIQVLHSAE